MPNDSYVTDEQMGEARGAGQGCPANTQQSNKLTPGLANAKSCALGGPPPPPNSRGLGLRNAHMYWL